MLFKLKTHDMLPWEILRRMAMIMARDCFKFYRSACGLTSRYVYILYYLVIKRGFQRYVF